MMKNEKEKTKEMYEAPVIETVEVIVERGFQESGPPSPGGPPSDDDPPSF